MQTVSERLVEVEHDSDAITHQLYKKINSSFITPFDREDIYRLGSLLDDVMDHLEAVGSLLYLYGLTKLPSLPRELHEIVKVLDQQARLTAEAMPRLKTMKNLEEYWVECNRLENEGDNAYRMLLVRLFSGEYDALHGAQDEGGRRRARGRLRRLRARGEHGRDHRRQGVLTSARSSSPCWRSSSWRWCSTTPTGSTTPPTRSRPPSPPGRSARAPA